jgi:hypothetical protein
MNPHCLNCGREIEESDIWSNYCEECDGRLDDPHDEPYTFEEDV